MKLSPFDYFFKTVCQVGRCNPYIDQIIKQHGKVFGDIWGVLVLQVNLPRMTEFIADCPASVKHIQNVRTNPKQIDFFQSEAFFYKSQADFFLHGRPGAPGKPATRRMQLEAKER